MDNYSIIGAVIVGVSIFSTFIYFAIMLVHPEWVGISGKVHLKNLEAQKDQSASHEKEKEDEIKVQTKNKNPANDSNSSQR